MATATRCWPKPRKRIAEKPDQYYSKIYGLQEVGGTSVLYLSAVPFEQIGLRTNVPQEPLPETTWRVLELVPDVVSTGTVLLGGIWWITNRRAEVAKKEGRTQDDTLQASQNHRLARDLRGHHAERRSMPRTCACSTAWAAPPTSATSSPGASGSAFDVMCGVGLAAGGFTLVAIVHIFNIEKYKPVLRPAILTAFLGYTLVVVGLLFDLGRPDRLWHPLVMWNPHSVMFEVAWCVTLYTTVLFLEFLPVVFEKFGWHKPLEWIHTHLGAAHDPGRAALHPAPELARHAVPDRAGEAVSALVHADAAAALLRLGDRGGPGDDDLRILAQQPRLRPRAGTAAAGQHGPRAGGGAERLPVDPLPRSEPPRTCSACWRRTGSKPGCSCWRSR